MNNIRLIPKDNIFYVRKDQVFNFIKKITVKIVRDGLF